MNFAEEALKMHEQYKGKLSVVPKVSLNSKEDLSTATEDYIIPAPLNPEVCPKVSPAVYEAAFKSKAARL